MIPGSGAVGLTLVPLLVALAAVPVGAQSGSASSLWDELRVPGGTGALLHVLPPDTVIERSRLLLEIIRGAHDASTLEGFQGLIAARLQQFLDVTARFEAARAEYGRPDVTLRDRRGDRLEALMRATGFEVGTNDGTFLVADESGEDAAVRRRWLARAGLNLADVRAALNAGEGVPLTLASETVPLPLSVTLWTDVVFDGRIAERDLFFAIGGSASARLLYVGLFGLDEEVLALIAADPNLLRKIARDHSWALLTVAGSLHVDGGRIVVPGGSAAEPHWAALVGESPEEPARFIPALLGAHRGRVAYFFDTLAGLRPHQLRSMLPPARADVFEGLANVFVTFDPGWRLDVAPFARRAADPAAWLRALDVTPAGTMAGPPWRRFWDAVFAAEDVPPETGWLLSGFQRGGEARPDGLARHLFVAAQSVRQRRVHLMLFAQRMYPSPAPAQAADLLIALRGFFQYPALLLTLERMGIDDPNVHAGAVRRADAITALATTPGGRTAVAQFQASIALIDRARFVGSLTAEEATELVWSLLRERPETGVDYGRRLAAWLSTQLLPKAGARVAVHHLEQRDSAETTLVAALAGPASTASDVEWEGEVYSVRMADAEYATLLDVRRRQGGAPLDVPLALLEHTPGLGEPDRRADAVQELRDVLSAWPVSAGTAESRRAVETLIDRATGAETPPADLAALLDRANSLLAEVLMSLAYAPYAGGDESRLLAGGNPAVRHDFGLDGDPGPSRARRAWTIAEEYTDAAGRRLRGGLLGLDLALGRLALRRLAVDMPQYQPALNRNHSQALIDGLVLTQPSALTDADRRALLAAIDRGGDRVLDAATAGGLREIAGALRMSGWRRNLIDWTADHDPERLLDLFSLVDLFWLGDPMGESVAALHAWGGSTRIIDGALRLRFPAPGDLEDAAGLPFTGAVATRSIDLKLRVAGLLADLQLPAVLTRDVLSAALQDHLDAARPAHGDDWLTLSREARRLSSPQVQDYVSMLTAGGPLVPAGTPVLHEE